MNIINSNNIKIKKMNNLKTQMSSSIRKIKLLKKDVWKMMQLLNRSVKQLRNNKNNLNINKYNGNNNLASKESSRNNSKMSFSCNFLKPLKNKTKNCLNVIIP